ncbi:MAG: rhodanese-like domain-containing protein [Acidiferrobacterales bacterium]
MLRSLAFALILLLVGGSAAAAPRMRDFFYVDGLAGRDVRNAVVVDTRPLAACTARSLPGARCLPPHEFLGPHNRLASFRDIVWVLGAAGLSGRETVLVTGDDPVRRDFVAGILYLAGQFRVAVLAVPLTPLLVHGPSGPGTPRGMFRNPVYQGQPRARLIVLRGELAHALHSSRPPYLLDGRSRASYWGRRIRALRGGHLPGAQPLSMTALRLDVAQHEVDLPAVASAVAYANNAYDSIAYFTLLRAGAGFDARVFPGGWEDWAYHTSLPVDAETYQERLPVAPAAFTARTVAVRPDPGKSLASVFAGLGLAAVTGYYIGRRRA